MYGTLCSLNLIFPSVTMKPMLDYCKQAGLEKGDTVWLQPCKAWLLSYLQEQPAQSLGAWDLIVVVDDVFHILGPQE